jgi:ABC-2 type transport system ATP-binding protein
MEAENPGASVTRPPLIEVENLTRNYAEHIAVNKVSFTLGRGEVLGFLGPNGAGKSTTMQMITGCLAPTSGQVTVDGHDLIDYPIEAKRGIGYLPENPPVYREMTVDEYLMYCARLHRIAGPELKDARDAAKEHCALQEVGRRLIGNLSKGFQQRVGIAQAIIHQPPVVILDEPTIGLDPIQIREIRALIKSLGQDRSVILSTHILPEVQATCDRVQIIRRGELIYNAPIDELNRHGQRGQLTIALRNPPTLQDLERITGVSSAEILGPQRFRIHGDQQVAVQLARLSAEHGWDLFELVPDNSSLEDIFVELTTSEPVTGAGNGEQAA